MFFNIYDILQTYYKKRGLNDRDLVKKFRQYGLSSEDIQLIKNNCQSMLSKDVMGVICEISGLSPLELDLMLGYVPEEYEVSYYNNIHKISELLTASKTSSNKLKEPDPCWKSNLGRLYNGDCLEILPSIPDESVDLIFADPPFNLKKDYGTESSDNLTQTEYINWSRKWIDQCIRILKPGGSLYIYNIPKWCMYYAQYLDNKIYFQNWIAIDMKNSFPIRDKFTPSHYGLLYFTKGKKANTFHKQRLPIQTCRHCGGELKDYGGYKNKMNPCGVNISDVWYDIYPVRKNKNRPYNELSVKLLERIISCSSNKEDIILDPFGGSGTTYAVAELLERRWIGIELGNCDYIRNRLSVLEMDRKYIERVLENKNNLFTKDAILLRKKNGFWLAEDFK